MNKAQTLMAEILRQKIARSERATTAQYADHITAQRCENCDGHGAKWRAGVFKGQEEEMCLCDQCAKEIESLFGE